MHERNQYTATFNSTSWKNLPAMQQAQHTLQNCKACEHRFVAVQALFPVHSTRFISSKRPKASALSSAVDASILEHGSSSKGCSKRNAVEIARTIYHRLNPSFESACNMSLSDALVHVQELKIEGKKSKNEKRKERRHLYKRSKQVTEAEWAKTDVVR